eukprot:gene6161-2774_t
MESWTLAWVLLLAVSILQWSGEQNLMVMARLLPARLLPARSSQPVSSKPASSLSPSSQSPSSQSPSSQPASSQPASSQSVSSQPVSSQPAPSQPISSQPASSSPALLPGAQYGLVTDYNNWVGARLQCQNMGGDLAWFDSYAEYKDVIKHYEPVFAYYDLSDNIHHVWIGLTDQLTEGVWYWAYNDVTPDLERDFNIWSVISAKKTPNESSLFRECAAVDYRTATVYIDGFVYEAYFTGLPFYEAEDHCRGIGGHLASFSSQTEFDAVTTPLIATMNAEAYGGDGSWYGPHLWIGLTETSDLFWGWLDKSPVYWVNYGAIDFYTRDHAGKNCTSVYYIFDREWIDRDCAEYHAFICKRKDPQFASPPPPPVFGFPSDHPLENSTVPQYGIRNFTVRGYHYEYVLSGSRNYPAAERYCSNSFPGGILASFDTYWDFQAVISIINNYLDSVPFALPMPPPTEFPPEPPTFPPFQAPNAPPVSSLPTQAADSFRPMWLGFKYVNPLWTHSRFTQFSYATADTYILANPSRGCMASDPTNNYACPPPPPPPALTTVATVTVDRYTWSTYATPVTWAAADVTCKASGGFLASFHSQAEYDAVMSAFAPSLAADAVLWIGLNDRAAAGSYIWADSGPVFWTYFDPLVSDVGGSDCVAVLLDQGNLWNVLDCYDTHPYICKFLHHQASGTAPMHPATSPNPPPPPGGLVVTPASLSFSDVEEGSALAEYSYGAHTYYLFSQRLSWEEAERQCIRNWGHLVWFDTQTEMDSVITSFSAFLTPLVEDSVWIGLNDVGDNGVYTWSVDDSTPAFENWNPASCAATSNRQPDNFGGQQCVGVDMTPCVRWNDDFCTYPKAFICKSIDNPPPPPPPPPPPSPSPPPPYYGLPADQSMPLSNADPTTHNRDIVINADGSVSFVDEDPPPTITVDLDSPDLFSGGVLPELPFWTDVPVIYANMTITTRPTFLPFDQRKQNVLTSTFVKFKLFSNELSRFRVNKFLVKRGKKKPARIIGDTFIKYTIYDFYGNVAKPVYRLVTVYDPCPAMGEIACPNLRACSLGFSCSANVQALLSSIAAGAEVAAVTSGVFTASAADRVVDVVAPVIRLLPTSGQPFESLDKTMKGLVTRVTAQNKLWVDPGWRVTDNLQGSDLPNVERSGWEKINLNDPTPPISPYIISYNVYDYNGNRAETLYRLLHVDCPSVAPFKCGPNDEDRYYCASSDFCIPDSGPLEISFEAGFEYASCPVFGDTGMCDLGATASDRIDGDLTYRVKSCPNNPGQSQYLFALTGVTTCGVSSQTAPGDYIIELCVENSNRLVTCVTRKVTVLAACLSGERRCSDNKCSVEGSCASGGLFVEISSESSPPPTITLINYDSLTDSITLKQGFAYKACQPNQGHEFVSKGVQGCVASNPEPSIGVSFTLRFVACDNWYPAKAAFVDRTISIIASCVEPTPHRCDGVCYAVPCSAAAQLNTDPPADPAPILTLLPPGSAPSTSNQAMFLVYEEISTSTFDLCDSASPQDIATGCVAIADDGNGNDISASISITDVTACPVGATCFRCTPALLSLVEMQASNPITLELIGGDTRAEAEAVADIYRNADNQNAMAVALITAELSTLDLSTIRDAKITSVKVYDLNGGGSSWAVRVELDIITGFIPEIEAPIITLDNGEVLDTTVSRRHFPALSAFNVGLMESMLAKEGSALASDTSDAYDEDWTNAGHIYGSLTHSLGAMASSKLLLNQPTPPAVAVASVGSSEWAYDGEFNEEVPPPTMALDLHINSEGKVDRAVAAPDVLLDLPAPPPGTRRSLVSYSSPADSHAMGEDSQAEAGAGQELTSIPAEAHTGADESGLMARRSAALKDRRALLSWLRHLHTMVSGALDHANTVAQLPSADEWLTLSTTSHSKGLKSAAADGGIAFEHVGDYAAHMGVNLAVDSGSGGYAPRQLIGGNAHELVEAPMLTLRNARWLLADPSCPNLTMEGIVLPENTSLVSAPSSPGATCLGTFPTAEVILMATLSSTVSALQTVQTFADKDLLYAVNSRVFDDMAVTSFTNLISRTNQLIYLLNPVFTLGTLSNGSSIALSTGATLLRARGNGVNYKFTLNKFTAPSNDYLSQFSASSSGMAFGRRRLQQTYGAGMSSEELAASTNNPDITAQSTLGQSLLGFLGGYPIYDEKDKIYEEGFNLSEDPLFERLVGAKGNRIMGGLWLRQVRRPIEDVVVTKQNVEKSNLCDSKYANYRTDCLNNGSILELDFATDGPFGKDPTYYPLSSFFDDVLATKPELYYNLSEMTSAQGDPYGFEAHDLADYGVSYPLVFDTHLPNHRAQELLQFLRDGSFLNNRLTKELSAQILTFNPDTKIIGYWKATFKWASSSGFITVTNKFQGLPAIDYSNYINSQQYGLFLTDWIIIILTIIYLLLTGLDMHHSLRHQKRVVDEDNTPATIQKRVADEDNTTATIQLSAEEAYMRKMRAKQLYRARMDWWWIVYEIVICALMVASIGVLFWYIFDLSPNVPLQPDFNVYDAGGCGE